VQLVIRVLAMIGTIISTMVIYKKALIVIGFFFTKKYPKTENYHKYGICVPARNEGKVIKNLLDSIAHSDYPLDKITVFVVAHNCTDNTAKIARKYDRNGLNVVVFDHKDSSKRTKGFALQYLFEMIEKKYGRDSFDGYFVFDADNVIAEDYLTRMNEAFDSGNKIVTSFRNSKNFNQNWISHSYAMHWLRTCLTENRGKSIVNLACRIQGTGFLFANELVKNGWNYTSLTEDRSFCSDAVIQNYQIAYCEKAVFYDEQPYKLKMALRQRLRWAKGHLQSSVENCPKLLKNMLSPKKNFFRSYDCFFLNFPFSVENVARKILSRTLKIIVGIMAINFFGVFKGLIIADFVSLGKNWIEKMVHELLVYIKYYKYIEKTNIFKRIWLIVTFPIFDIIGKWCSLVALFKKVEWKPITHDTVMKMEKLKRK